VAFLNDRRVIDEFLGGLVDPGVRAAAVERTLRVGAQAPDPREVGIRLLLLDPAIAGRYGRLDMAFQVALEEKRYVKDEAPSGGTEALVKGKVLVENVALTIRRGDEVLFKKAYRGRKARKAEAFNPEAPEQGGYLMKVHPAELDYVEIAQALLAHQAQNNLKVALGSKSKYIHAAAAALSDSWRGGGAPKIASEHDEASDDD